MSFISRLSCSKCGVSFDLDLPNTYCPECVTPILAGYDIETARLSLDREIIQRRPKGMWRWHELLPVENLSNLISLGEGDTPLLHLSRTANNFGLDKLYVKDESFNPTGTFKARGLSAAVSKAKELGQSRVIIPTAGNAGGAMAAYAARAGMSACIYMPRNSPKANIDESLLMGAEVILVDGLINIAAQEVNKRAKDGGWFDLSTFKEPYRLEGKKIIGFELAEQLDWDLPDVIIYPTGGGTGLVGMWKAFDELERLGWLSTDKRPRMVSVQADGCSPIVKAYQEGLDYCDVWENAETIATGLCVPRSFADFLILEILRISDGTAIAVSDEEILNAQSFLAQNEGIFACPEGAATFAALEKLINTGWIASHERVVLFNTGTGLKYL